MNRFHTWALSKKLGACFGAMMALSLGFGFYSDYAIATLGKSQELAVNGLSRKVELAGLLDAAAERMRSDTRLLALAAYAKDEPEAQMAISDFQATAREYAKSLDG